MGEDYIPTMLKRMHEKFLLVKYNMQEARDKNKQIYNKRAEKPSYQPGDPVYLHDKTVLPGTSSKLTNAWKPYYRIVERVIRQLPN